MQLKDYISEDGSYIIPVTWEVYSTVRIYGAKNLQEALEIAERYQDDFPAEDGDYIDGSYKIDVQTDEDILNAQDYASIGYDFYYKRND